MEDQKFTTRLGLVTLREAKNSDAPAFRELRLEALKNNPVSLQFRLQRQRRTAGSILAGKNSKTGR